MTEDANHPVQTTEKSLALLQQLKKLNGARIRDLEGFQGMTKGAIHNHLSTLKEQGYVRKDGHEYRLGFQLLALGGHIRSQIPVYQTGRPKVNQLAADTGMLANLLIEDGGKGVYLYQARGEYAINLDTHVGYRVHLHYTGIGKAILAFMPEKRIREIIDMWGLPKATENTITDRDELLDELERICEQGYATDHEERTKGLACIAAPIRLNDDVLGAVSVSASTQRLGSDHFDEDIISEVESTANEIALDIRYRD